MEPSQFLITLLITGFLGSILAIAAFFLVLKALVPCPECGTRVSRKARHCQQCGIPLSTRPSPQFTTKTPATGGQWPLIPSAADAPPVASGSSLMVDTLYTSICALQPDQRTALNQRLRDAASRQAGARTSG